MNHCISCSTTLLEYNTLGKYCPNCFSIYAKEIPSDKELSVYYNKFNESYTGGGRSKGAIKRQNKYANIYIRLVNKYANGKSLIDIGSSTNPFPNVALAKGYQVTIADFVKPKNLNGEIKFIESSLENIDTIESYDVVTAFAVIEHTRLPIIALGKLIELCKVNGIIIIYIPEIGHFSDKYALGTSGWFSPPEHINLLSKKCLNSVMTNLKCEQIYYSRFELNITRYLIRYGIGFVEGIFGIFVKTLNSNIWNSIRQKRISKHNGMSIFVFRKL